jgi:sigma54-dependent transcription regulator
VRQITYVYYVNPVTRKERIRRKAMLEKYNYWISLIHSGDTDTLIEEINEEMFLLSPEAGQEVDITLAEAWNFAEDYIHEDF